MTTPFGERIDALIAPFAPERALKRREARTRLNLSRAFRGAERSRLTNDWEVRNSPATPGVSDLAMLRNRVRDLNRNDAVAAGATDTIALNVAGQGLRPQSRIRADRLGISEDQAHELRRQAEAAWAKWAPLADSADILTFDDIQFQIICKVIEDGEAFVIPTWADEDWRPYKRVLEIIEADRVGGRGLGVNGSGIEVGGRGQPLRYHIRKAGQKKDFVGVDKRDADGRPRVLHLYQQRRPGQQRGYPMFAPVLGLFKHLNDYMEAEVVAARVAACLGVFVTSGEAGELSQMTSDDTDAEGNRISTLEPGMVRHLGLGESIQVVDPKRPGDAFDPFVTGVLRFVGMALNLPYELLVKDFSKTTYSSARAALIEGRRMFMRWRRWLGTRLCQPVWELVLEEAYLRGDFDARDFYDFKTEYCPAFWVGGGWGWVEPVKEVQSSRLAVETGISTLAEECAAQGRDWEEVAEQLAREKVKRRELKLEDDHDEA